MQLKTVALVIQIILLGEFRKWVLSEPLVGFPIRDAKEKEFSFVVSIGLINKYVFMDEKFLCAGTLISRWHVLTAASCLEGHARPHIQVTIGSVNLRKGRAFFSEAWITYAQWAQQNWIDKEFSNNDIAIIKLTEKVNEPTIVPAKVGKGPNEYLFEEPAIVVGWGFTNDLEETSIVLQVAAVTIPSSKQCAQYKDSCLVKPTGLQYHPRYLCSKGKPYVLLELGDSGGPLIYQNDTVVGISLGKCPSQEVLNPELEPVVVKQNRVNIHLSTSWYADFIDDVVLNYFKPVN